MIDDQLRIDAKGLVEQIFMRQAQTGNVSHGVAAQLFQTAGETEADAPEIPQGLVAPEQLPVAHLVQLRDTDTVLIRRNPLGHDIHGDLGQVHIGADAGCGGDAGVVKHIPDHGHGQFMGCHIISFQITGDIHEAFIHGIDMDVFIADIFHVDREDFGTDLLIELHARRSDDVVQLQGRIRRQLPGVSRFAGETVFPVRTAYGFPQTDGIAKTLSVDFFYTLNNFEQTGAAGNAVGLKAGGDGQADRLLRAGSIRHNEIRGQCVQIPCGTFHGGIKAFEVNGNKHHNKRVEGGGRK